MGMVGLGYTDRLLSKDQVRALLAEALGRLDLEGRRLLIIIPDSTRTAPMPLMFQLFHELLSGHVTALDCLVALGTHPLMSEAAISRLVGITAEERADKYPKVNIFNHRWDLPEMLANIGTIRAAEIEEITGGLLAEDVPVTVNKRIFDYDWLIVCGPVFPHGVAGFSGGSKYFFPGISGPEIINFTHWLGAIITSMATIGIKDTPVRRVIERAKSFVDVPTLGVSMVVTKDAGLAGLYIGSLEEAWSTAADLSAKRHVVYVGRPFKRVLSVASRIYDDLWTGAKAMYKVESVVADGGEVIVYAPHISEVSFTHGEVIDRVGYHVRDYFLKQIDHFQDIPRAVLAHCTHLKGMGTYDAESDVEEPRIRVTLATGIPQERCQQINLGYLDPATLNVSAWEHHRHEGILVVHEAGEQLYRLKNQYQVRCTGSSVGE